MSEIRRDERKFKELILYVSARAQVGATKLNKILFHADFGAYRRLGMPITGHPYVKRENGPAPRDLRPARTSLVVDGSARLEAIDVGAPKPEDRVVPLRDPIVGMFGTEERAIIDAVVDRFASFTGQAMANETHLIPGWLAAKMDAPIPYSTALISGEVTDQDRAWGERMAAARDWT